ncbi:metallophosphoesterase family protein [Mycoplasmopsis caviae]|uniref:Metallophosphoesterase family protein n=1 Tax=Mycoplasmopsis caviae TaxID=55603 RepID=A0A3P8MDG0_9BACT|nr:metallophosphoesterase family protein [Mycoplasmopsis caviae]UUD35453.1 metallophosphoesterase family protein [Mycoplasmopsis caviae]VDR41770.1 Uncharacterised protein [Mycoplasmopsis caviae]
MYGHSHYPVKYYNEEDGMYVINPGSISEPKWGSYPGYTVIEINHGSKRHTIDVKMKDINKNRELLKTKSKFDTIM